MKKVHILTFHNALNYGAVLQCYALYKTINKKCACDVLDYHSKSLENRYKLCWNKCDSKRNIKMIFNIKNRIKKKKEFSEFISKNIVTTHPFLSVEELENHIWNQGDIFCVGSDQVWNRNITDDKAFKLNFVSNEFTKISYAASFGLTINPEYIKEFDEVFKEFSGISIRESEACNELKKTNILCTQNVDPVFLLEQEEWNCVANSIPYENKSYVLIYLLQKADEFEEKAIDYARKRGLKVLKIKVGYKRKYNVKYVDCYNPSDFLGYFRNADTIFTNSFHGISFSIVYNKNFYCEAQGNGALTNSRIEDVLKLFALENRNVYGKKTYECSSKIIYKNVNEIIKKERDKSMKYLATYLTEEMR